MTTLAYLEELVLGPLRGRTDADCQSCSDGRWSPAQIVEHLALGLDWSAQKFSERRTHAPMARRPGRPAEHVAKFLIMRLRWFPPGRKAPERSVPGGTVTRASAERHFRDVLAVWERLTRELLPGRRANLFVKHPRLGDLTLEEWLRFHGIHARHHARQIRQRLPR
jgi:hypothetical protein